MILIDTGAKLLMLALVIRLSIRILVCLVRHYYIRKHRKLGCCFNEDLRCSYNVQLVILFLSLIMQLRQQVVNEHHMHIRVYYTEYGEESYMELKIVVRIRGVYLVEPEFHGDNKSKLLCETDMFSWYLTIECIVVGVMVSCVI